MNDYDMDGVRQERSGWRDLSLSKLHRQFGFPIACMDIDYIEYYNWEPVAVIEAKMEGCKTIYKNDPEIIMIKKIANKLELPAFAVKYSKDLNNYIIVSLNDKAMKYVKGKETMDKLGYVTFLYTIRGLEIPEKIKERILGLTEEVLKEKGIIS